MVVAHRRRRAARRLAEQTRENPAVVAARFRVGHCAGPQQWAADGVIGG
jgi:hypothetical protein